MRCHRFRAPGSALPAGSLVERAEPRRAATAGASVAEGRLRVAVVVGGDWEPGGEAGRDPAAAIAPGTALCLVTDADPPDPPTPFLADPSPVEGWLALAPAWPWRRGALRGRRGAAAELDFTLLEQKAGVGLFALRGALSLAALRERLAAAGIPILADTGFGGRLVAGGLRVTAAGDGLPAGFWPDEPVFPADPGELAVSAATLRALQRGHPWILRDARTGDTGRTRPGQIVRLRGPRGERAGLARVDDEPQRAARLWAPPGGRSRGVAERVEAALERRRRLLAEDETSAFRLVHGEADGLPGLFVDRLGSVLRVIVRGASGEALRVPVTEALLERLAASLGTAAAVVEVIQSPKPPGGVLFRAESVRVARGGVAPGPFVVAERGMRYRIELGLGAPERPRPGIGLFLDQRENRRRVAVGARGGRFLNLFAHTGSFSAVLLRAGAAEVTSVDLSGPYLAWTEANLALNELPLARHRALRGDARRLLEGLPRGPGFDGIVLDPPTAAAAGRRFFHVKRDLGPMVRGALARLRPGGWLLVSRNDRARRGDLADAVQAAARDARVALAELVPAPPGDDFPPLRGFPEGDPMRAVLARVAS